MRLFDHILQVSEPGLQYWGQLNQLELVYNEQDFINSPKRILCGTGPSIIS